jgi:hypothetical protein
MDENYAIYLNGQWFDSLRKDDARVMNERSIWTTYQLMKPGTHRLAIVNEDKQIELETRDKDKFKSWIKLKAPQFLGQLDMPIYNSQPDSRSMLKNQ